MSLDSLKTIKCGALRPDSKPETVDVACRERPEDGGMSRVVKYIKLVLSLLSLVPKTSLRVLIT